VAVFLFGRGPANRRALRSSARVATKRRQARSMTEGSIPLISTKKKTVAERWLFFFLEEVLRIGGRCAAACGSLRSADRCEARPKGVSRLSPPKTTAIAIVFIFPGHTWPGIANRNMKLPAFRKIGSGQFLRFCMTSDIQGCDNLFECSGAGLQFFDFFLCQRYRDLALGTVGAENG